VSKTCPELDEDRLVQLIDAATATNRLQSREREVELGYKAAQALDVIRHLRRQLAQRDEQLAELKAKADEWDALQRDIEAANLPETDEMVQSVIKEAKRQEEALARVPKLEEELAALKAIVEKLPKTADGVVVMEEIEVWHPGEDTPGLTFGWNAGNDEWGAETCECYSTREAAQQAACPDGAEKGANGTS